MQHKQFNLPSMEEKRMQQPMQSDFELKAANILRTDKDLNIKTKHVVTDTETAILHGQRIHITSIISGAGTTTFAKSNDYLLTIEDLAVARSVELPSAVVAKRGKAFIVKDLVGGAGSTTITIASKEGETIDGSATATITSNYGVSRLFCDGTNWYSW